MSDLNDIDNDDLLRIDLDNGRSLRGFVSGVVDSASDGSPVCPMVQVDVISGISWVLQTAAFEDGLEVSPIDNDMAREHGVRDVSVVA